MSISDMLESINAFSDKDCGVGATGDEISTAEESLGENFSESYRSFLKRMGWGRFSHQELYGLGADVPRHLELVRNTFAERSVMVPPLPSHLIPVMNDGAGNHFCLDTFRLQDGECPIVFWDHEESADQIPDDVSPSFDRWIIDVLTDLSSAWRNAEKGHSELGRKR